MKEILIFSAGVGAGILLSFILFPAKNEEEEKQVTETEEESSLPTTQD